VKLDFTLANHLTAVKSALLGVFVLLVQQLHQSVRLATTAHQNQDHVRYVQLAATALKARQIQLPVILVITAHLVQISALLVQQDTSAFYLQHPQSSAPPELTVLKLKRHVRFVRLVITVRQAHRRLQLFQAAISVPQDLANFLSVKQVISVLKVQSIQFSVLEVHTLLRANPRVNNAKQVITA
jgi:hypothetical protein